MALVGGLELGHEFREKPRALVVVDLPFLSYQASPEDAVRNAGRLMKRYGFTNCQELHAGAYSVVVSNLVGTTNSLAAVLKVLVPPAISASQKLIRLPAVTKGKKIVCLSPTAWAPPASHSGTRRMTALRRSS